MPEVTARFEVFCLSCGEGLCNETEVDNNPPKPWNYRRMDPAVKVPPCPKCIEAAEERAREEAREEEAQKREDLSSEISKLEEANQVLRDEIESMKGT